MAYLSRPLLALGMTLALTTTADAARAQSEPPPAEVRSTPDLVSVAQRVIDRRHALADVWPGYWPTGQSFILHDPNNGWVEAKGDAAPIFHSGVLEGGGRPYVFDFPGSPPDTIMVRWVTDERTTLSLIFHEQFHDFQKDRFTGAGGRGEFVDLSFVDDRPAFTADLELERRVLAAAIRADTPAERTDLARRYLALRRDREERTPAPVTTTERARERTEGSADFAGFLARGVVMPEETLKDSVLWRLDENLFQASGSYVTRWFRQRSYGVGAAILFLIDQGPGEWRARVEKGEALDVLLGETVGEVLDADRATSVRETRTRFDAADLTTQARAAFSAGRPQPTSIADFHALGARRVTLKVISAADEPPLGLSFSGDMHPLSTSAMGILNLKSFAIDINGVAMNVTGLPILLDLDEINGQTSSTFTVLMSDLSSLPLLAGLPQGETVHDDLTLESQQFTLRLDRPVRILTGPDEIIILVDRTARPGQ